MEDVYSKILEITGDSKIELAAGLKDLLHKELCLGQTRFVCRNGTLSPGHEKITPAQRYYQAIREMYYLGGNMRMMRAQAMEAQADLIDAERTLGESIGASKQLRAEAAVMKAKERLMTALVTLEDQMRQLDEYNKVRTELQSEVRAQYPEGIEQAEPDNWEAVAKFRTYLAQMNGNTGLTHVPLTPEQHQKLLEQTNRPEWALWNETLKAKESLTWQKPTSYSLAQETQSLTRD